MELMSSVLLCALVTFLPQALGKSKRKYSSYDNEFGEALFIKKKSGALGTKILLNKNAPFQNKISDLQSTFMDPVCRGCYTCMERAMTAHRTNTHIMHTDNYQDDRNMIRRDKRKVESDVLKVKKSKKSKPKKNKGISVIKYEDNGKIYALKITETISALTAYNNTETVTSCQVYSIKKHAPCELPEANLILSGSKKKVNKKGKKGHGKRDTKIVETVKRFEPIKNLDSVKGVVMAPIYTKRIADDSQIPDQIMPSIEEIY